MSSENWSAWVTTQRQEYSLRLKSGRATSASESSFSQWPTPDVAQAQKVSNRPNHGQLGLANHPEVHGYQCTRPPLHKDRKGLAKAECDYSGHSRPGLTSGSGSQAELSAPSKEHWPTPQAHDSVGGKTPEQVLAMRERTGAGVSNLNEEVHMWRTPSDPTKRGGSQPEEKRREGGHTVNLEDQVHKQGKLNPRWVETLMGLPIGWTMPSCVRPWTVALTNCDSSETGLIQMSPNEPSGCSMAA